MPTAVAIVRRRLRDGKTYEDFRKAWYHTTGFGTSNRMFTLLNAADPREIIVIALTQVNTENAERLLAIDAAERQGSATRRRDRAIHRPHVRRTHRRR